MRRRRRMRISSSHLSVLFSLLLFLSLFGFTLCLSPDGLALLSLKSAVDSASSVFADWNEDDDYPCRWTGVSCMNVSGSDGNPRVVGVAVAGKQLHGYIPSELGSLLFLRRLNLHDNRLHGSIPVQLFNASSLHSLFLYGNNISGVLPPSICQPPRLQNLDLSANSLSGGIPAGLKSCRHLQRLVLARNSLSGRIPAGVFPSLLNLVQLDLSSNHLQGSIPPDIGELKSLAGTLNLSFNRLSGGVPKSLGNLPETVNFDLRSNNLTGEIPQAGSFGSQGPTAFLDNPFLCGFPLQQSCKSQKQSSPPATQGSNPAGPTSGGEDAKKGLSPGLITLISLGDAAGVTLIGLVVVYVYWKRKDSNGCSCTRKGKLGDNGGGVRSLCSFPCLAGGHHGNDSEAESERGGGGKDGEGELVAIDKGFTFELDELLRASAYVLGKSGMGIVYKVVLGNGIPVAVRRLGDGGEQRHREFAAEVQAIGRVKHPNVVRLRAYYWAPDEKLLITDFISNGNLASALRGKNGQPPSTNLSWSTRLKIAKGTARGLAYLHECSPRKFAHGDIKPSNILLDADFNPFISDFGLSRLITLTEGNLASGGSIGGNFPYLKSTQSDHPNNYRAPEARIPTSRPAQKGDVFSFGVILLELLTGKSPEVSSPTTSTAPPFVGALDLVRWVQKGFEEETLLSDMVDPMLLQEVHAKKEVLATFHVALACTESDPEVRPRMKNISESLERIATLNNFEHFGTSKLCGTKK